MGEAQTCDSGAVRPRMDAFAQAWIAPIPGTTNPAHLDDFLGAATVRLTPYEMEEFDKEYARIDLIGHRADPFTESQIDK